MEPRGEENIFIWMLVQKFRYRAGDLSEDEMASLLRSFASEAQLAEFLSPPTMHDFLFCMRYKQRYHAGGA